MKIIKVIAAVLGFLGVSLGAFGAHALRDHLSAHEMTQVWQTAIQYHLIHAGLCFLLTRNAPDSDRRAKRIAFAWIIGIILFSGSLYGMALGGPKLLGPITPLGGLFLLYGWGCAAWDALRPTSASRP